MFDMGVNTTIRDLASTTSKIAIQTIFLYTYQTEQVQTSITLFSALHALEDRCILVKMSLCDRHVDPDDVLPDDPTSTDVEVSGHDHITVVSEST